MYLERRNEIYRSVTNDYCQSVMCSHRRMLADWESVNRVPGWEQITRLEAKQLMCSLKECVDNRNHNHVLTKQQVSSVLKAVFSPLSSSLASHFQTQNLPLNT